MARECVGYMDVVKSSESWAGEVSAIGSELMKLGFKIGEGSSCVYNLQREETFFDVKKGAISLYDSNSWVRLSKVLNVTTGEDEAKYFVDYRKGIDGDVKKFRCPKRPNIFELESITRIYDDLRPVIDLVTESYHIQMLKQSPRNPELFAVLELVYKIQKDKARINAGEIVSFELKDKTLSRFGEVAVQDMDEDIAKARAVVRRFARENNKEMTIGNPYMDIKWAMKRLNTVEIDGLTNKVVTESSQED